MSDRLLAQWSGRTASEWQQVWDVGRVELYESVGSTNDVAASLAAQGAAHLSIVIAEEQRAGRGRGGASWLAEPGESLLFSLLFRFDRIGVAPGCVPVRMGLFVAEAITTLAGRSAALKWPNDVVMPGYGKVAGILCEGSFGSGQPGYVVAGIGINVSQPRSAFRGARVQGCSIAGASGRTIDRAQLLGEILARTRAAAERLTDPLTSHETARIRDADVLRGANVICDLGTEVVRGTAQGIAQDGALLVDEVDAVRRIYNATVRIAEGQGYPGGA